MLKYKILAGIVIVLYFLQSFLLSYGGIGADSLSYFGIASDFPDLKTNLFPLGYPLLLKSIYFFLNDYFWTYKVINVFLMIFIILFSWKSNLFFRETVLLFTGKTLFLVFTSAISENLFIFFLYFLGYHLYKLLQQENVKKHVLWASVIMFLMFMTRYSGIYIYSGIIIFFLWMIFSKKYINFFNPLFFFLLFSGVGILGVLAFNFVYFESFVGENLRGTPAQYTSVDLLRNIFGSVNAINPFIGIKPSSNSYYSLGFQFVLFIVDVLLLFLFIKKYKKFSQENESTFHQFLWITAFTYTLCLFLSGFFQQIEEQNVRMLAAANFCLFFSWLILYFQSAESDRFIWKLSVFFLFFTALYSVKTPVNFLKKRREIAFQMGKFKEKKYLFNDERLLKKETTYVIPIIHKEFNYIHTNSQTGEMKQTLAGSINPQIKWLKQDTVKDKSKVLYTSQLVLK